jgi:hypothetical protein
LGDAARSHTERLLNRHAEKLFEFLLTACTHAEGEIVVDLRQISADTQKAFAHPKKLTKRRFE